MKKWIAMVSVLLLAGLAQADVLFTGSNTLNNLMSDTNNWEGLALPVTGDNFLIAANGTSVSNPAVVDSSFTVDIGQARVFSSGAGGTGMAYVEVVAGGTLKASSIYVGNSANQWYDGTLTLRTGAATVARYLNSGGFEIAGTTELSGNRAQGFVTVQPGASFSHAILILKQYGTLTYEFGANSVTPFIPSKTSTGGANTLDGLVKVDLSALVNEGSYALIDGSSTNVLIAGAMKTWLDGEGGSFSGAGDFSNATFQVVSGGTIDWTLSLEDGDQDLMFAVSGGGLEEEDLTLFGDTFDRADSTDVNLNSAANQSGLLAPLTYGVYTNATPSVSAISSNEVLLEVDGSGNIRLAPLVDLSDSGAAIVGVGGFEISYTVDAGIDFLGTVHGQYSTALILSQASMVAGAASGAANSFQGLYITIAGNGQVRINSQGASLFNLERSEYDNAWQVGDPNDVRLTVETDGFLNTSSNLFTLYINEVEVCSTNFFWKTSNDLGFALEAISYSALFDNLKLSKLAPPQFTANGVPYAWLDDYYDGLVSDADYENAANTDTDGDGLTGLEEYLTGTDPTDPASVFALRASGMIAEGMVVTWPSMEGALYDLSSKSNLMAAGWTPVATGITGLVDETSYTATVSGVSGFFSVEMQ
jgi:hypothetical protein